MDRVIHFLQRAFSPASAKWYHCASYSLYTQFIEIKVPKNHHRQPPAAPALSQVVPIPPAIILSQLAVIILWGFFGITEPHHSISANFCLYCICDYPHLFSTVHKENSIMYFFHIFKMLRAAQRLRDGFLKGVESLRQRIYQHLRLCFIIQLL